MTSQPGPRLNAAFYADTVAAFLRASDDEVYALLASPHGYTLAPEQLSAWRLQLPVLRAALAEQKGDSHHFRGPFCPARETEAAMPGLMITGDTSLFDNVDEYDFRDELIRHMLVTVERGPGKVLHIRGVHMKDLASFRGPVFQVDRDEANDAIVLRQVQFRFWPWDSSESAVASLEDLLRTAFEDFYESLSRTEKGWFAKERDCVNRFVMGHLVPRCSPGAPIEHPAQIGMEIAVKMPDGRGSRPASPKDIVIWDSPFGTCWTPEMEPLHAPLAVLEWKSQHPTGPSQNTSNDEAWLRDFCEQNPASDGYSVSLAWTPQGLLREISVKRCRTGKWNNAWFRRPL
jgi:hypothetical protein